MLKGDEYLNYIRLEFRIMGGIINDEGFDEYMNALHVDAKTAMSELTNCISEGNRVEVVNMFKGVNDDR